MRNVILVTIDSLRADHCGFLGYDRNTTPTLDRMASEGLEFKNAIAPGPSTYESMPAIFTGNLMTPYMTNESDQDSDSFYKRTRNIELNMNHETIPEMFARRGYSTAAFTTNPYTSHFTPFSRGFDEYEDFISGTSRPLFQKLANMPVVSEIDNVLEMVQRRRATKPWQSYYDQIIDWIDSAEEPYFVWIFLLDPHSPYLVDPAHMDGITRREMYYHNWKLWLMKKWGLPESIARLNSKKLIDLYDRAIRSTDDFLKRLLDDVASSNPVTAVHADHGEGFGEHGIYDHEEHLYSENIHVPMVIHNCSVSESVSSPVSVTDLPYILYGAATDEVNLPSREYTYSRVQTPQKFAIRGETWKYICRLRLDGFEVGEEEIYDLTSDPEEKNNLVESSLEMVDACRELTRHRLLHEQESISINRGVETLGTEM